MSVTLQAPSLVDALHMAMREQILTGELPAGEPVTEVDLAKRFSVARPTAKAAMERLVHEGLLNRATNKTARVPVLTVEDVKDLYYSRSMLEREVMKELASRKVVSAPARRFLQDLLELVGTSNVAEIVATDVSFHLALVAELKSPRLSRLYGSLMGEMRLCMAQVQAHNLLDPARIADEHSHIAAGDEARAVAEVELHLQRACTRLTTYLEDAPPRGR